MVRRSIRKAAPKRGRPAQKLDQKLVSDLVFHYLQERGNNRHVSPTCCNLNLSASHVSVSSVSSVSSHNSDCDDKEGVRKAVRAALRHGVKRGIIEQCPSANTLFRIAPIVSKHKIHHKPQPSKYVQMYSFLPDDSTEGIDGPSDDEVLTIMDGRQCACSDSVTPERMLNRDVGSSLQYGDLSTDFDPREVLTHLPTPSHVCTTVTDIASCASHQKIPPPRYCADARCRSSDEDFTPPEVNEEWLKRCRYEGQRRSARKPRDVEEFGGPIQEYDQGGRLFKRVRERSPTPWRQEQNATQQTEEDPGTSRPRTESGPRNPISQMGEDQVLSIPLQANLEKRRISKPRSIHKSVSSERKRHKAKESDDSKSLTQELHIPSAEKDDSTKQSKRKRSNSSVICADEVENCDCDNNDPTMIPEEKVAVVNDVIRKTRSKTRSTKVTKSNNDKPGNSKLRRESRLTVDQDAGEWRNTRKRRRTLSKSLSPITKGVHSQDDDTRIGPKSESLNIGNMKLSEAHENDVINNSASVLGNVELRRDRSRSGSSSCEDCKNMSDQKKVSTKENVKRSGSGTSKRRSVDRKDDPKMPKSVRFSDEVQTSDDNAKNKKKSKTKKCVTIKSKNKIRRSTKLDSSSHILESDDNNHAQQQIKLHTCKFQNVPTLKRNKTVNNVDKKRGRRTTDTCFKKKRPKKEYIIFQEKTSSNNSKRTNAVPRCVTEDCSEEDVPMQATSSKDIYEGLNVPQQMTTRSTRSSNIASQQAAGTSTRSYAFRPRKNTSKNYNENRRGGRRAESTPERRRMSPSKRGEGPTTSTEEDARSSSQAVAAPAKVEVLATCEADEEESSRHEETVEPHASDSTHSCFERWAMRRPMLVVPPPPNKKRTKVSFDPNVEDIPPGADGKKRRNV